VIISFGPYSIVRWTVLAALAQTALRLTRATPFFWAVPVLPEHAHCTEGLKSEARLAWHGTERSSASGTGSAHSHVLALTFPLPVAVPGHFSISLIFSHVVSSPPRTRHPSSCDLGPPRGPHRSNEVRSRPKSWCVPRRRTRKTSERRAGAVTQGDLRVPITFLPLSPPLPFKFPSSYTSRLAPLDIAYRHKVATTRQLYTLFSCLL
jgi:hypothetical protein